MSQLEFELEPTQITEPTYRADTIARYRVALIYETSSTYDQAHRCGDPEAAACFLHELLQDSPQEAMGGLLLDTRNRAIGHHIAYRGSLNRIAVEPRGLLVPALLANAAAFIAFHNHPSGDPSPSAEDLVFTKRLAEAGDIVGVRLLDHIILGESPAYTSLRSSGCFSC